MPGMVGQVLMAAGIAAAVVLTAWFVVHASPRLSGRSGKEWALVNGVTLYPRGAAAALR